MQNIADFTATALGTEHPTLTGWYLAEEGPREHVGGGVTRWNRTYNKKPATRYTFENYAYPFIGYMGLTGMNVSQITGREREVKPCLSRITHEYYRIAATGGDATSPSGIAMLSAQKYYYGTENQLVNYLADSPPFTADTTPSRSDYEGWITAVASSKWAAASGVMVAEDSRLELWMGVIYVRQTRYVLAQ